MNRNPYRNPKRSRNRFSLQKKEIDFIKRASPGMKASARTPPKSWASRKEPSTGRSKNMTSSKNDYLCLSIDNVPMLPYCRNLFLTSLQRLSLLIAMTLFILPSCKVSYSFTGASISPSVKTVTIPYFPNNAGPCRSNFVADCYRWVA